MTQVHNAFQAGASWEPATISFGMDRDVSQIQTAILAFVNGFGMAGNVVPFSASRQNHASLMLNVRKVKLCLLNSVNDI